jgi:uncharacterized HAD superfamily protein
MLPAGIVACERHRPLYSVSRQGLTLPTGGGARMPPPAGDARTVLIVDDTVCSGGTFAAVVPAVQGAFPAARVLTAAVYVTPKARSAAQFSAVELDAPHYLEWNLFNSGMIRDAAVDFDGILCEDCPAGDDDDGDKYARFLAAAQPLHLPRKYRLRAIVTARLEKYRPQTVGWLDRWGVRCEQLVMGPWRSLSERRAAGPIGRWKAEQIEKLGCNLFVESDPRQAQEIVSLAATPILCPKLERVLVAN